MVDDDFKTIYLVKLNKLGGRPLRVAITSRQLWFCNHYKRFSTEVVLNFGFKGVI